MKIIVVGSISSGMTLAEGLAAGETSPQITLYEKAAYCSCGTGGLPHYLGLKGDELGEILAGCALSAQGGSIRVGMEVTAVDPVGRTVTVRDGETGAVTVESYDKLVLATGSESVALQAEGGSRMGIHPLRRVEDLLLLREFIRTPYVRDIVVLGGGLEAMEVAGAFRKLGRGVRVIDCGQGLLPGFDSEVRSGIQRELEEAGIVFHLGERVTAFQGRTFVETVVTVRGSHACDLCVSGGGAQQRPAAPGQTGRRRPLPGGRVWPDQPGGRLRRRLLRRGGPGPAGHGQRPDGRFGGRAGRLHPGGGRAAGSPSRRRHCHRP